MGTQTSFSTAQGNLSSMSDRDSTFPDDVPLADAAEQLRLTADSPEDDEHPEQPAAELPLEASAADWQEQQEVVVIDDESEESD